VSTSVDDSPLTFVLSSDIVSSHKASKQHVASSQAKTQQGVYSQAGYGVALIMILS